MDIIKQKGKLLALILRHDPKKFGIKLDKYGWAEAEDLVDTGEFTFDQLYEIVKTNAKKRFVLDAVNGKIRALQGHSIKVDLQLTPAEPPKVLYHGTTKRFKESILNSGIKKRSRQHVHLSADTSTARSVGMRRSKRPVILTINALEMYKNGHIFYLSENGVWLTDFVPERFIQQ